jgi:hypothetical protein
MKNMIQELKECAEKCAKNFILENYQEGRSNEVNEEIPFILEDGEQVGYLTVKGAVYELVPAQNNWPEYPDDPAEIETELHELEVKILNALGNMHVNLTRAINKSF